MAISTKLQYAKLKDLYLDAKNPRLVRHQAEADLSQAEVLDLMSDWVLEELAVSYLESGFWTHEALLVVEEKLYGRPHLVVVEGNRRLAALKYLYDADQGKDVPQRWKNLVENTPVSRELFDRIPYIQVGTRREIESFLGFRHVTGVKQWPAEQKAQYITKLIDERKMSYIEVMRKIGSTTPAVRQNYISYRLLLQMEDSLDDFSVEYAQGRFSVMYLSLRTQGVQTYLNIDISADPGAAQMPVPKTHLDALAKFALWLFGNQQQPPLFTDSRRVDDFGTILENSEAIRYLEDNTRPDFDYAFQLAGGDESNIAQLLNEAATNVKIVLSRVHHYKNSEDIQRETEILGIDVQQLLNVFPSIRQRIQVKEGEN